VSDVRDPGAQIADKILDDLEALDLQPTEVARQARRLRAHIEALRATATAADKLIDKVLGLNPTGVIGDGMVAQLHSLARDAWLKDRRR
jgi:predicted ribonuclease YlaK